MNYCLRIKKGKVKSSSIWCDKCKVPICELCWHFKYWVWWPNFHCYCSKMTKSHMGMKLCNNTHKHNITNNFFAWKGQNWTIIDRVMLIYVQQAVTNYSNLSVKIYSHKWINTCCNFFPHPNSFNPNYSVSSTKSRLS